MATAFSSAVILPFSTLRARNFSMEDIAPWSCSGTTSTTMVS